jgi:hypothetical protein
VGSKKVENGHDVSYSEYSELPPHRFLLPAQFGGDGRLLSALLLNASKLRLLMAMARRKQWCGRYLCSTITSSKFRPPTSGLTFQAGIIVRDGGSFRFFAASRLFEPLEGRRFENPQKAEKAALRRMTDVASRKIASTTKTEQEAWNRP